MAAVMVQYKVKDYEMWRKAFVEGGTIREAAGVTATTILQAEGDPNNITILLEVQDLDRVRKFAQSPELKAMMQRAGVITPPNATYFSEIAQLPSVSVGSIRREAGGWSAGEM